MGAADPARPLWLSALRQCSVIGPRAGAIYTAYMNWPDPIATLQRRGAGSNTPWGASAADPPVLPRTRVLRYRLRTYTSEIITSIALLVLLAWITLIALTLAH